MCIIFQGPHLQDRCSFGQHYLEAITRYWDFSATWECY